MHQLDPIKEALIDAQLRGINVAVVSLEKEIPDTMNFARGLVYGSPLIDQIRARGGSTRTELSRLWRRALRRIRRQSRPDAPPGDRILGKQAFRVTLPANPRCWSPLGVICGGAALVGCWSHHVQPPDVSARSITPSRPRVWPVDGVNTPRRGR